MDRYSPFSIPTSVWVVEAYVHFQVYSSLCSDAIVFTKDGHTDGRTDRHSSNVSEFRADQMSPRNIGSQIIISRCYKRIDKTNIPSLRRVEKETIHTHYIPSTHIPFLSKIDIIKNYQHFNGLSKSINI